MSTTYYINDNSGDDSNDGSISSPWKTLGKFLNSWSTSGDVGVFYPGIYYLDSYPATNTNSGAPRDVTVVGIGNVVFKNVNDYPAGSYAPGYDTYYFYNINFITPAPLFKPYQFFNVVSNYMYLKNCGVSGSLLTACQVLTGGYSNTLSLDLENVTHLSSPCATGSAIYTKYLRCTTSGSVLGNTVMTSMSPAAGYTGCFLPMPMNYSTTMFPCANWVDDSTYSSGRAQINSTDLQIASGSTSARILSEVLDYGENILFRGFGVLADEITDIPGSNAVVDSTPLTTARTFEYRTSNSSFASGAASPAWDTYTRGNSIISSGRYLQYRITLIQNGA